jgi:hypothetical protein
MFLLLDQGRKDDALDMGRRLRAGGFTTPAVLVALGDLLAEKGDAAGARRAYSEIVESNPWDPEARRLLGDVFLRQGWYEDAYRQYSTLMLLSGGEPGSMIRLARAAAGAGRTDEALRVLKAVLDLSLEPSAADPREWARLWSVDGVARLLAAAPEGDSDRRGALARAMRRTEAFQGPGVLWLLTWRDLDADLQVSLRREGGEPLLPDEVAAGGTGLTAARLLVADAGGVAPVVSWRQDAHCEAAVAAQEPKPATRPDCRVSRLPRTVVYSLLTVRFNGKDFVVSEERGEVQPPGPATTPRKLD